jgi:molybdate transport system ATP-binding protein
MREPEILLLDEFTNALDSPARRHVLNILESLAESCVLVLATHRLNMLPSAIQREVALESGRITHAGPLRARRAGMTQYHGKMSRYPPVMRPEPELGPLPLIDIRNATVYLEREPVLHAVNWRVLPGEHWLVSGGNGAGKSTLLRLVAAEEYPAAGGEILRRDPQGRPVHDQESLRKGIRLLSNSLQAAYAYDVTGLELVLSGLEASIGLYREYAPEEINQARQRIAQVSNNAENLENRSIRSLSTGQMRRLLLARALAGSPYLLLLDEPFSGMDEGSRLRMLRLLAGIAAAGTQLVMVSHHETDMPGCITHILTLDGGRIVGMGPRRAGKALKISAEFEEC